MTITPTDPLAEALAARQAANGDAPVPHDPATGEVTEPSQAVVLHDTPPSPELYRIAPDRRLGALPFAPTYFRLARSIAGTELVPAAFRGRPEAVAGVMMYAYEIGLQPFNGLMTIQNITGTIGLKPEGMRGLISQAGHQIIPDAFDDHADMLCHRSDWPADMWRTVTFTLDDAVKAALCSVKDGKAYSRSSSGKPMSWEKYTRAMLTARATAEAGRRYFADVLHGLSYTPEEIADFDRAPEPVPAAPPPGPPLPPEGRLGPEAATVTAPSGDPGPGGVAEPPAESAQEAPEAEPAPDLHPKATRARGTRSRPSGGQAAAPTDAAERRALISGLQAVITGLPRAQQGLVRGYLAQQGMGDLAKLTPDQLTEACRIAAGWPTSVKQSQETADGAEDGEDVGEIHDAEVIEEPPEGFF